MKRKKKHVSEEGVLVVDIVIFQQYMPDSGVSSIFFYAEPLE
jgi:hypothetical protein